jgi:hypothetical protein
MKKECSGPFPTEGYTEKQMAKHRASAFPFKNPLEVSPPRNSTTSFVIFRLGFERVCARPS